VLGHTLRRVAWWFNVGFFNADARADACRAFANPHVTNLFRGLMVKFFFVPLMLMWTLNLWNDWENTSRSFLILSGSVNGSDTGQALKSYFAFHHMYYTFLIMLDLSCALAGYCISMRLIDSHITTAEPTLFGWAMALACYPPFNNQITGLYLPYDTPNVVVWQTQLKDNPYLLVSASVVMLALMTIYTWGTLAFGLRFSNLTNRGLVCCGPYRYIRHPAYICKNLAWWIEYMPFTSPNLLDAVLRTVHMLIVNLIYWLRAYTEERHLMREPHYREYCKKVPWRFIPGIY
jgi:protein-S-isoprenylcysteine O-methyltransferase Ste14